MANPAACAQPIEDVQGDGRWMSMHEAFVLEAKGCEPELLFIGDSILAQLQQTEVWVQMFEPLHCLNFSIGGDQTQNLLWRIQNGELENFQPKVIVLMVGTNNYGHSAQQIAGGILEIVATISKKQPQAEIVVMGLLPRGEKPNKLREKMAAVNASLEPELAEVPNTTFLNIDPAVFYTAGTDNISRRVMWDYLHLTVKGYWKLCKPLLDEIQPLLKNYVKVESTSVETASMAGELASDQP